MKKIILFIFTISSLTIPYSCSDDFTDPQLEQNDIIEETQINSLSKLETFVNGTYALLRSKNYYGCDYIVFGEVRGSDEMYSTGASGRYLTVSQFTMISSDAYAADTWKAIYKVIANTNIVINADITDGSSDLEIQKLKAEAYALRALAYFDLIKLYGQKYTNDQNLGVPLILENPKDAVTFISKRATLDECYLQIESDFEKAYANAGSVTGVRLGKSAIAGLMSRYFLFKEDYKKVYEYTDKVTSQSDLKPIDLGLYITSWRIEGLNSIFELAYGVPGAIGTTGVAYMFSMNGYANVRMTQDLVSDFEANDVRIKKKANLTDKTGMIRTNTKGTITYLEGKYPVLLGEANQKIVRYEEIALNQAEAILMGGGGSTADAIDLVNKIRAQRGIDPLTSITMDVLKEERRKELVGEGFRVWDLLRWNKALKSIDASGQPGKVLSVGDSRLVFPIPQTEIDNNKGISKDQQNKGY